MSIRYAFGFTQKEMYNYLGLKGFPERGILLRKRHPQVPLWVLFRYARSLGIAVDVLIGDNLDLPKKLPNKPLVK